MEELTITDEALRLERVGEIGARSENMLKQERANGISKKWLRFKREKEKF